ncbi:MAG: hypothetical protein CM1200mP2_43340 [Planctomycetaceae bacterium]|nr:MAG: hypothetical protein CM1200mP2_43340 [Planctomycetaceae bacterium]
MPGCRQRQTSLDPQDPDAVLPLGWGAANSPILHEDKLFFCLDDDPDSYLVALDKYSGKQKWLTKRPEMLGGYSVPVVVTSGKQTDIVMAGSGKLKGYNPETGKVRWNCNSLLRTIMTTPAVVGDKIYVSVQSYGDTARTLKFALLHGGTPTRTRSSTKPNWARLSGRSSTRATPTRTGSWWATKSTSVPGEDQPRRRRKHHPDDPRRRHR